MPTPEEQLRLAAATGQTLDFENRETVLGKLISDVLSHPDSIQFHPKGLRLRRATITNADWEGSHFLTTLHLVDCRIEGRLQAQRLQVDGDLYIADCTVSEGLDFSDATINGRFTVIRSTLNPDKASDSLRPGAALNGIKVSSDLDLHNTNAIGEMRLVRAQIGGDLVCSGASIETKGKMAFNADGVRVTGDVLLDQRVPVEGALPERFRAKGEVRFAAAQIGGQLLCSGAFIENEEKAAFSAGWLAVTGAVFLDDGFRAKGEVRFPAAQIGGALVCSGASIETKGKTAFNADGVRVTGDVLLDQRVPVEGALPERFRAKGEVRFPAAQIGGDLGCGGASIENEGKTAFNADGVKVTGNVFLDQGVPVEGALPERFQAKGEVRFVGAELGKDLICTSGIFINATGNALLASDLFVKGNVWLCGAGENLTSRFEASGRVSLIGAEIGALYCGGATLDAGSYPTRKALDAANLVVHGDIEADKVVWQGTPDPSKDSQTMRVRGELSMASARVEGMVRLSGASLTCIDQGDIDERPVVLAAGGAA